MTAKHRTKSILLTILAMLIVFTLAAGASILAWIVGSWTLAETGDKGLATFVGYAIYGGFAVSLGLAIGVANYLREVQKQKKALQEAEKLMKLVNGMQAEIGQEETLPK